MFAGLMALLFGLNGLNVVNNYVGRNFMTASPSARWMSSFGKRSFTSASLPSLPLSASSRALSKNGWRCFGAGS